MSSRRPTFDEAKKFSDFVGMIVRALFCIGLTSFSIFHVTGADHITLRILAGLSAAIFLLLAAYMLHCIGQIIFDFIASALSIDKDGALAWSILVAAQLANAAVSIGIGTGLAIAFGATIR